MAKQTSKRAKNKHRQKTQRAQYQQSSELSTNIVNTRFRLIIFLVALVGCGITAYLTYTGFTSTAVLCFSTPDGESSASGCSSVLQTSWARFLGAPLALFGFIAYVAVASLAILPSALKRADWESYSALGILLITASMSAFSLYLMIGQFFLLDVTGICYFCIASALISLILFGLSFFIYKWPKLNTPLYATSASVILTLIIAISIFNVEEAPQTLNGRIVVASPSQGSASAPYGWNIETISGEAEKDLATHLAAVDARMYGVWWCPHCNVQKQLFGEEASKEILYVECDSMGINPQPRNCIQQGVTGYPTWVINNESYAGLLSLEELANITGYTGQSDFRYIQPQR